MQSELFKVHFKYRLSSRNGGALCKIFQVATKIAMEGRWQVLSISPHSPLNIRYRLLHCFFSKCVITVYSTSGLFGLGPVVSVACRQLVLQPEGGSSLTAGISPPEVWSCIWYERKCFLLLGSNHITRPKCKNLILLPFFSDL